MDQPEPSVLGYTNYRTFLNAHGQRMKARRRTWNYSAWARQLGLKGTASLTMILNGQRHPGPRVLCRLVDYFKFSQHEKKYFEELVTLAKVAGDPALSTTTREKLVQILEKDPAGRDRVKYQILDPKAFQVISQWYVYAIRELVQVRGFREDPDWIQKKLRRHVQRSAIRKSIENLLELGLLARRRGGGLEQAQGRIHTTDDVAQEALKRFHEQMIQIALDSIRTVPVQEREIAGSTFAFSSSDLPRAKEWLRRIKSEFVREFESERNGDAVYQVNVQFFPLSNGEES